DTFGPFCLLDLSSAGTVDQTMREGIRDAWHDADMNFETFATDLRALLTGGETIDLTYWKLDEVPYGQEIDTNNVIFRYTRTVSVGSSGTETAEGSATSDTENCTGFPLKTLGDSFKGSGLWMDQVHTIGFGDHADFSFGDGSNDSPMSLVVWADWEVPIANGYVIDKYFDAENEYYVRLELNGKLKLRMEDASVNKAISRYSSSPVDGELHCWVFTYAGDSDETNTHFYLDGDLNDGGASKQAGYIAMEAGTSALRINHLIGSGSIYNAQLYNRELSAGEIQALYAQGAYV
ncbi:hypothetical protein CMI37_35770, partial [Candidatus Pacearchaeota archaeon]|nr:hypothetical protein [Candidatus Pacearchaeota archaeon]